MNGLTFPPATEPWFSPKMAFCRLDPHQCASVWEWSGCGSGLFLVSTRSTSSASQRHIATKKSPALFIWALFTITMGNWTFWLRGLYSMSYCGQTPWWQCWNLLSPSPLGLYNAMGLVKNTLWVGCWHPHICQLWGGRTYRILDNHSATLIMHDIQWKM